MRGTNQLLHLWASCTGALSTLDHGAPTASETLEEKPQGRGHVRTGELAYLSEGSSVLPENKVVTSRHPLLPTPWTWQGMGRRSDTEPTNGLLPRNAATQRPRCQHCSPQQGLPAGRPLWDSEGWALGSKENSLQA